MGVYPVAGGGHKNPGSNNRYTRFGQLIIRKITKIIAMSHFKAKMHQIRFLVFVRLSICPLMSQMMEFDTYVLLYSDVEMRFTRRRCHCCRGGLTSTCDGIRASMRASRTSGYLQFTSGRRTFSSITCE